MKLGISYNLFDGYELLESSVTAMRPMVDHISVVFQETSNNGKNKIDKDVVLKLMNRLVSENLIDTIIEFKPNHSKPVHNNELDKRQVGFDKADDAGCSHYLSMDVDEFYLEDEFNTAKKIVEDGGYDASIVNYVNYYGDFNHQMQIKGDEFVPFIYKITSGRKFKLGNSLSSQFICDPTRQMQASKVVRFKPSDIFMHHMSYVRNGAEGMRMKLANSSANVNWCKTGWVIDTMVEYYKDWTPDKRGAKIGNIVRGHQIVENTVEQVPLIEVDNGIVQMKFNETNEEV
jgi:hypothetical protein